MNTGSEASEQIVRVMLQGTEIALRLTGSATKNMAAMLYAYQKDKGKLKGKTTLGNMLKEGKELQIFSISEKDLPEFKMQSKKYRISTLQHR